MFSQSILDLIKASATDYVSAMNAAKTANMSLSKQISLLIDYNYNDEELEQRDILTRMISETSDEIRCEQRKARRSSSLYNSNRHIALHDLNNALQKKREKMISAL